MNDRIASVLWIIGGIAWGAAAVIRVGLLLNGDHQSAVSLVLLLGIVVFALLTRRKRKPS